MDGWRIAGRVRWAEVDGRITLLDLRSESYHALDPVASEMWRRAAHPEGRAQALHRLHQCFDVDPERLASDFDAFVTGCARRGFLEQARPGREPGSEDADRRPSGRRFLTARAWWSLFRTSRKLVREGFARTYERFASLARSTRTRLHGNDLLERGVAAFARAENFYTLRTAPRDCLPRSLALFGFLRTLGIPAEHRIGVQSYPFVAHAWVECAGRVLHDDPLNPERFTTIARLPA
jgi:hypothetical protein